MTKTATRTPISKETPVRGVSYYAQRGVWKAYMTLDSQYHYFGSRATQDEASKLYDEQSEILLANRMQDNIKNRINMIRTFELEVISEAFRYAAGDRSSRNYNLNYNIELLAGMNV